MSLSISSPLSPFSPSLLIYTQLHMCMYTKCVVYCTTVDVRGLIATAGRWWAAVDALIQTLLTGGTGLRYTTMIYTTRILTIRGEGEREICETGGNEHAKQVTCSISYATWLYDMVLVFTCLYMYTSCFDSIVTLTLLLNWQRKYNQAVYIVCQQAHYLVGRWCIWYPTGHYSRPQQSLHLSIHLL